MSFDIYLQCFAGEPPSLPRAAIRGLFPVVEDKSEPDYWRAQYEGENFCNINVTPAEHDNDLITSLSVNRPCGDLRFWESVLGILRLGRVVLYWPGGGPLVAGETTAADVPLEIIEALGQPRSVNSAQEIIEAIQAS